MYTIYLQIISKNENFLVTISIIIVGSWDEMNIVSLFILLIEMIAAEISTFY